jgi:ubiquitin-protein ligase
MSAVRLRRLQADYAQVQDYVRRHPRVELIQTDGNPPERYQLQYQIRSLRQKDDRLEKADRHLVEITLPLHYPRTPPQCRMLSPIFHPNIAPHAICIGDHWSAGEPLASLVARIGELIAYQSYNTKSPLNGEAARWTNENLDELPLDPVSMLLDEDNRQPSPAAAAPVPRPAAAAPVLQPAPEPSPQPLEPPRAVRFSCPGCDTQLKAPYAHKGKQLRCPRCRAIVRVPGGEAEG